MAWLADAHTRAEKTAAEARSLPFDEEEFRLGMRRRFARFGCGEDKIAQRGHELADFAQRDWQKMEVYRLHERGKGEGMLARTRFFGRAADRFFEELYPPQASPPAELVHVTCTGYESPSAAQRLVAARAWGRHSRVMHAYHMGCYAAVPALRSASGLALANGAHAARVDVVHTELCALHLNPSLHTPEQMVIQTLFADGCIAYSITNSAPASTRGASALCVLALEEETVSGSSDSMTWVCADSGMQMTLARDVPERIGGALAEFVERLCEQAQLSPAERQSACFAVHPGGPRILDQVRDGLGLAEAQIAASRRVLFDHGNMSSATLPHVWMALAEDPAVLEGSAIVSLAFGPGLTLAGAVLRKVAA